MSVNDDFVQSSSDSFWELGKHMRTVKRCDNGFNLCIQLRKVIEERSEIERKYASLLTDWCKKWNSFLDKCPEYGTTQGAWRGVLTESDEVADLHITMADNLMMSVHSSIKAWQKENYHKSMMHFKETKEFEDGFRKVQKPWGKHLAKVVAAKKEYHAACRGEKSMTNQENNARGDTTVSHDQLTKLQDKLRKCNQEVEATQEKYNAALNDLNSYNPKYIEDMTEVYNKCQDFEQKRMEFFKETMFKIHDCLNLSDNTKYKQVYNSLHSTIGNLDPSKDLKWWSANHGVEMHMNWPEFEEYSPGLQSITKRGKSNVGTADGGIMITKIKHSRDNSYGSYTNDQPPTATTANDNLQSSQQQPAYTTQTSQNSHIASSNDSHESPVNNGENPFEEPDVDFHEQDPAEEGWVVRALYSYSKAEEDELELNVGDVFRQTAEADEMGWCKGTKDGVEGFFPTNYVEKV